MGVMETWVLGRGIALRWIWPWLRDTAAWGAPSVRRQGLCGGGYNLESHFPFPSVLLVMIPFSWTQLEVIRCWVSHGLVYQLEIMVQKVEHGLWRETEDTSHSKSKWSSHHRQSSEVGKGVWKNNKPYEKIYEDSLCFEFICVGHGGVCQNKKYGFWRLL